MFSPSTIQSKHPGILRLSPLALPTPWAIGGGWVLTPEVTGKVGENFAQAKPLMAACLIA